MRDQARTGKEEDRGDATPRRASFVVDVRLHFKKDTRFFVVPAKFVLIWLKNDVEGYRLTFQSFRLH